MKDGDSLLLLNAIRAFAKIERAGVRPPYVIRLFFPLIVRDLNWHSRPPVSQRKAEDG
jgi:hypothetical protein